MPEIVDTVDRYQRKEISNKMQILIELLKCGKVDFTPIVTAINNLAQTDRVNIVQDLDNPNTTDILSTEGLNTIIIGIDGSITTLTNNVNTAQATADGANTTANTALTNAASNSTAITSLQDALNSLQNAEKSLPVVLLNASNSSQ